MLESRNVARLRVWQVGFSLLCVVGWLTGSVAAGDSFGEPRPSSKSKKSRSRVQWPQTAQPTPVSQTPNNGPDVSTFAPNGAPGQPPALMSPLPETQGPVIGGPPGSGPMIMDPPVSGMGIPGQGTVCTGNDYWIISSRSCKKREAVSGSNCCLHYFHSPMDRQLMPVERQTFFSVLNPTVPVCFVIHGSYNRWGDVVDDSRKIHHWIRSANAGPLQVVFFTWSSDGNMPFIFPVDIAVLGRRSSFHALYLAQLITQMPPEVPVSMMGHSHGARVAVSSLHLLGGGVIEDGHHLAGPAAPRRIRATLIAPALDHHWLNPGQRYGLALSAVERMLLVRNHRDTTLALYPLRKPFGQSSMGYRGLNQCDWMQLEGQGSKITDLDAARIVKAHHSWASYYRHQELAMAIAPYVYFQNDSVMGIPESGPTMLPAGPTGPMMPVPATGPTTTSSQPAPRTTASVPKSTPRSTPGWKAKAPAASAGPVLRIDPTDVSPPAGTANRFPVIEEAPTAVGGNTLTEKRNPPVQLELDDRQSRRTGPPGAQAD